MAIATDPLSIALDHHRHGRLAAAETGYRAILAAQPHHADALHLLGVLALQVGRPDAAAELIERALHQVPGHPGFLSNLGEARRCLGDLPAALACFRQALARDPAQVEARINAGLVLAALGRAGDSVAAQHQALRLAPAAAQAWTALGDLALHTGQPAAALAAYRRSLAVQPQQPAVTANLAQALALLGRDAEALAGFRAALTLGPPPAEACSNLGTLLGRHDPAAANAALRQAVILEPARAEFWFNLGNQARSDGNRDTALAAFRRTLAIRPDFAAAAVNLGLEQVDAVPTAAPGDDGTPQPALRAWRYALTLQPDLAPAWLNLGTQLQRLNQPLPALACYQRARVLGRDQPEILGNIAALYHDLGRLAEAGATYDRAITAAAGADTALFRHNRGLTRLLGGDLAGGWPDFEARLTLAATAIQFPAFDRPRWHGESLAGRTLLLHAEQGLGDTVQMLRYLPLLAGQGARLVLMAQPPLLPLLSGRSDLADLRPVGTPLPACDCWLPLMSLPLRFGTTLAAIPAPGGYLQAEAGRTAAWAARLDRLLPPGRRRAGLVWAGNPGHRNDRNRSLPLAALAPLLTVPGWSFASLQKGPAAADIARLGWQDRLADLGAEIADFADTAAILAGLDLVISVDTSVLHLAGALGRPAWALLPHVPDWRWLLHRDDSPWYASLRLFRQPAPGDWPGTIQRLALALAALTSSD